MQSDQPPMMILTDHRLLQRLADLLERNEKTLAVATEQLGNARLFEDEAAEYMGVKKWSMWNYRKAGLEHEKIGRVISYKRKDLDAWREAGNCKVESIH